VGERTLKEVEALADKILRKYFCECDVEFLISTFADDIVWLGAGEMQKAEGKENVAACFREGSGELSPCDMFDEEYVTTKLADGCYLCEGVSRLQSKEGTGVFLRIQQRITFVFRESKLSHQLKHIKDSKMLCLKESRNMKGRLSFLLSFIIQFHAELSSLQPGLSMR